MHEYPLRINDNLFEMIKVEAKSRGIKISEMLLEIIERGLLQIYEEKNKKKGKEM